MKVIWRENVLLWNKQDAVKAFESIIEWQIFTNEIAYNNFCVTYIMHEDEK